MKVKTFFKPLIYGSPILLILLAIVMPISSLDGIVNAQLFGEVAKLVRPSSQIVWNIILIGVGGYGVVYTAIYVGELLKNRFIREALVKLKGQYVARQLRQVNVRYAGQITSTVLNEFKLLETNYYQALFTLIYQLSMVVFSTIYLLSFGWLLGLTFILFSGASAVPPLLMGKRIQNASHEWTTKNESFVQLLRETINGRITLLSYGFKWGTKRLNTTLTAEEKAYQKMNNTTILAQWFSWLGSILSFVGPILVGILLMTHGFNITGSALVSMLLASDRVVGPLRSVTQMVATIQTTTDIRQKMFANTTEDDQPELDTDSRHNAEEVQLTNISNRYDNGDYVMVPQLRIQTHDHILITGRSGIGKSTILRIVAGILKPTSGQITVRLDGKGLDDESTQPGDFAILEQTPFVISGTIAENIRFGDEISDEDCLRAIEQVGLLDELGNNPLKFVCEEDGRNLSGGQRQRLAIARALASRHAIILADEITASLDAKASLQVREVLYSSSKAVVEVAHHYVPEEMAKYHFKHYEVNENSHVLTLLN